jgi:RNA polymerase sigma factor (sigma-70 family)
MDIPHPLQGAITRELVQAVQRNGPDARLALDDLLAANESLAKAAVARLRPDDQAIDDELLQDARLGFAAAVYKYDVGRGTGLATYAWPFMRRAALRTLDRREARSARLVPLVWKSSDTDTAESEALSEPQVGGLSFDERVALYDVLETLPLPDRILLGRLYWQKETQAEAGAALGLTQQAVSKRHRRILATLQGEYLS